MSIDDAHAALEAALASAQDTVENFVIRGDALTGATVSRFELERDLAATVVTDVLDAARSLVDRRFLPYDPSYQTDASQVLVEELRLIPELEAVDRTLRDGDVPLDTTRDPVVAMAHVVAVEQDKLVAYRLKGPGIAARRVRGIPLIPRDGFYKVLDDEILYYEPRFDVVTCAGYAYFTTVSLIQTKLQADDKARELAKRTLADVTVKVEIDGFAQLEQAVMDDPTMRAKMAAVARIVDADPDYAQHLTTERLVAFVHANPDYDIPVTTVNGETVLAFDPSSRHRHQIPKLLADDFLHSFLTKRNYEAGSKHRVQK